MVPAYTILEADFLVLEIELIGNDEGVSVHDFASRNASNISCNGSSNQRHCEVD